MENLKTKPFCLDDVFSGKQIVTRGGLRVKIIHMKEDNSQTPLLGIRYSDGVETPMCWTMQGHYNEFGDEDVDDLFTVVDDDKTVGSHSSARPWGTKMSTEAFVTRWWYSCGAALARIAKFYGIV